MQYPDDVIFPEPSSIGPRQWGKETLLCTASGKWTLKLIEMKKGEKGGFQHHRLKDEGGMMLSGIMLVRHGYGELGAGGIRLYKEKIVGIGDVFHFPPGLDHQTEAITECSYVEVSTPHFNDRVHVEEEYGIADEAGGLPSTKTEEIEIR